VDTRLSLADSWLADAPAGTGISPPVKELSFDHRPSPNGVANKGCCAVQRPSYATSREENSRPLAERALYPSSRTRRSAGFAARGSAPEAQPGVLLGALKSADRFLRPPKGVGTRRKSSSQLVTDAAAAWLALFGGHHQATWGPPELSGGGGSCFGRRTAAPARVTPARFERATCGLGRPAGST
jgi:hypothetical protein